MCALSLLTHRVVILRQYRSEAKRHDTSKEAGILLLVGEATSNTEFNFHPEIRENKIRLKRNLSLRAKFIWCWEYREKINVNLSMKN